MRLRLYLSLSLAIGAVGCVKDEQAPDCVTEVSEDIEEPTVWGRDCRTVHVINSIHARAALEIRDGTTIELDNDVLMVVSGDGSIAAQGTEEQPITFQGSAEEKGFWSGLAIETSAPENELTHVELRDAGGEGYKTNPWVLTVAGTSTEPGAVLLEDVTIRHASGPGLVIRNGGKLRDPRRVRFEDIDDVPIQVAFPEIVYLDSTFEFSDVQEEYVLVSKGKATGSTAIPWMPIPYRITDEAELREDAAVSVRSGTVLEFEQDVTWETNSGSIQLSASADDPIILTGAEKITGFWGGVVFESISEDNLMENVIVEYAGAPSWKGHKAGVIVAGNSTSRGYVQMIDTTIREIDGNGVKIFDGGEADMEGTTFDNVSGTDLVDDNDD